MPERSRAQFWESWIWASPGERMRFHLVRWAPLLAVALLTYLAFPPPIGIGAPVPALGEVSKRAVVAPFAFEVRKSPEEIAREGQSRALTAQPVYRFSATAYDSSLASARGFFADLERASESGGPDAVEAAIGSRVRLGPEETRYLADSTRRRQLQEVATHFLAEGLQRGVADAGAIRSEVSKDISLRRGETERIVPRDSILTFADLMEQAEAAGTNLPTAAGQRTLRRLVGAFYHPTIVLDPFVTTARREQLRGSVDPLKYSVRTGERILRAGEPVTEEARAKLISLREEHRRRGTGGLAIRSAAGALLYNAIILSAFWLLIVFYKRESYAQLREMTFFAALFAVVVLLTAGLTGLFPGRPELIPIPFAAILVTMLYNGRIGVFAAVTLAILLDGQWALRESHMLFFGLVGGVAGAVGIRVVRRRRHLYVTIGVLAAASILATISIGLSQGWSTRAILSSALLGLVMALASAALAMMVMPIAESATRITTDLTLLELSDLGRPLLRRLALEAPGTWAHSLAMANLCESACNIIGANGLLARVGCYYHDIGKLASPGHFVENQGGGPNPHDLMRPQDSAKIIQSHVADGLALAEAAHLPQVVKAFIPEHHGTTYITYFLSRARGNDPDGRVDLADYRYPGPRPQSAETAVAMLADSAEAAIRVLPNPTPEAVRNAIEHLVQQKLGSGQLDDAPLTLRDLDRIKREFARVMSGTYHKRIGYPRASGGNVAPEFQSAERE
ncbi:MAG TPA: HDIG domain-containing protein [Gemmatimonadales bacterium]|nr:HDIG domain-containing protein [Gemmatimonadales bacterium]